MCFPRPQTRVTIALGFEFKLSVNECRVSECVFISKTFLKPRRFQQTNKQTNKQPCFVYIQGRRR